MYPSREAFPLCGGAIPNKCVGLRYRLTQPTKNGKGTIIENELETNYLRKLHKLNCN